MKEETEEKGEPYFANYTTIDAVKTVLNDKIEFRPYVCTKCDASYKWPTDLRRHLWIHSGYKPLSCLYCDRKFARQCNLDAHEDDHRGDRKHECPNCDKKFTTKSCLSEHLRYMDAEESEKLYDCPKCTRSFCRLSFLKAHMFCHESIKRHDCPKCSKSWKRKSDLHKHLLVHEIREAKMKILTAPNINPKLLNSHNQTQNNFSTGEEQQVPKHFCPVCCNGYRSRTRLDKHMNRRSYFELPVAMEKEQLSKFVIKTGQKEQDWIDENLHECPIYLKCLKKFKTFEKHYGIHVTEGTQL